MTPSTHDKLLARLARWRNDAEAFVEDAIRPSVISPDQRRLLRAASDPAAHVSVVSGTTTGKTAAMSWIAIWLVSCYLEMRVPCTATTFAQVATRLWPEIAYWHRKMVPEVAALTEWTASRFYHTGAYKDSSFAWMMAANDKNVESFQGVHAKHVCFVFDEAAGIPSGIWDAAAGSANAAGGRWIVAGNGNRASGRFYETHNKLAPFWTHFSFSSLDSPFCGPAYCSQMAAEYGEDSDQYRIRVLGKFPKDDPDTLVKRDWVQAAMDRQADPETRIPPVAGEKRIAGLDPNNGGADACGYCIRRGPVAYDFNRWHTTDHEQIAAEVFRRWKRGDFDLIHVERNGIGEAVVTVLRRLGVPVGGVDVSRSAVHRPRCAKVRDELWWKSREWFQGGAVGIEQGPHGDTKAMEVFVHEVSTPKWRELDRIRVESKDDLRRADRLGHSPDVADGFVMTLAEGVEIYNDAARARRFANLRQQNPFPII